MMSQANQSKPPEHSANVILANALLNGLASDIHPFEKAGTHKDYVEKLWEKLYAIDDILEQIETAEKQHKLAVAERLWNELFAEAQGIKSFFTKDAPLTHTQQLFHRDRLIDLNEALIIDYKITSDEFIR